MSPLASGLLYFSFGLFSLSLCSAQRDITNDTFFYGQSPWIPAPTNSGTGSWVAAYEKAIAFVAQLSLEEKVNLTGGVQVANGCSGNIPPIERVGFPGMCLTDNGQGVRASDFVSGFASGIHVGASWNKELAYQRGLAMGFEFRKKGVNVMLGPVVGPLGRIAVGGRNWEAFSNDPYLSGALVDPTVKGVQEKGVIACTKHFIGNEQELYRNPTVNPQTNQTIQSTSSNIDDRTMHELYLWPFADAVHAGTGSIMCSYNRINNSYGCQNAASQNGLLKTELGFSGFVVSDWFAQHSGVASALAGLDMVMPSGLTNWAGNLTQAVNNGSVPESRIDDMASRIIATWYQMAQDDPASDFTSPGKGMPQSLQQPHEVVDARDLSAKWLHLQSAIEGYVLVKNVNAALPLQSPRMLSVYGYSATVAADNNPGKPNPLAAGFSAWSLGATSADVDALICGFGIPATCPPLLQIAEKGTLIAGGGSGSVTPWYISAPLDALAEYAYENDVMMLWDLQNINGTSTSSAATDACLVFINAWATEGMDRPGLADNFSDTLVNNIADQCANTIVVIHNAGIRLVDGFVDHPNVTAILYAHLPGQDSGRSLVRVLSGQESPSGKLPYTVAKRFEDYGVIANSTEGRDDGYNSFPQDNFAEGGLVDYRYFDALGIEPRYEFGFGMTYTTFEYSGISVATVASASGDNVSLPAFPTGAVRQGGRADLWDTVLTVTADVFNAGNVTAKEVAQLYVTIPNATLNIPTQKAPVGRQLRGFEKVEVAPGATVTVTFSLTRRDLSVWDVQAQEWRVGAGGYIVEVGSSSRTLPLKQTVNIAIAGGGGGRRSKR